MNERPDWVIFGISQGNGVMVLASTELNEAELSHEMIDAGRDDPFGAGWVRPTYRYALSVDMREYVVIQAPTYGDAMQTLFRQWTPKQAERPAVEAQRQLEAR